MGNAASVIPHHKEPRLTAFEIYKLTKQFNCKFTIQKTPKYKKIVTVAELEYCHKRYLSLNFNESHARLHKENTTIIEPPLDTTHSDIVNLFKTKSDQQETDFAEKLNSDWLLLRVFTTLFPISEVKVLTFPIFLGKVHWWSGLSFDLRLKCKNHPLNSFIYC